MRPRLQMRESQAHTRFPTTMTAGISSIPASPDPRAACCRCCAGACGASAPSGPPALPIRHSLHRRGWCRRAASPSPSSTMPVSCSAFAGAVVLTDPIFSERCSPVSWAGPKRARAARDRARRPAAAGYRAVVAQPLRPHGSAHPAGLQRRHAPASSPRSAMRRHCGAWGSRQRNWTGGSDVKIGAAAHYRDPGTAFRRTHAVRPQPHAVGRLHDPHRRRASPVRRRFRRWGRTGTTSARALGRPASRCCRSAPMSRAGSWRRHT